VLAAASALVTTNALLIASDGLQARSCGPGDRGAVQLARELVATMKGKVGRLENG
jgi:hypothetical protein